MGDEIIQKKENRPRTEVQGTSILEWWKRKKDPVTEAEKAQSSQCRRRPRRK